MSKIPLETLLAAGSHFGHLTRRWNPKMKEYIFMERNGIHIIDLKKTQDKLEAACEALKKIIEDGYEMLFIGTKKQAQEIIKIEAQRCGMFYVTERWLGGTLTNFGTIKKSIKHMKNLQKMSTDGTYEKISKKEILQIEREKSKMKKVLEGIEEMKRLPGVIFIIDTKKEQIGVNEARKLGIPIIAIVDTNSDPSIIDYPIPANDDAAKSVSVISRTITDAVIEANRKVMEVKEVVKEVDKKKEKKTQEKEQVTKNDSVEESPSAAAVDDKKEESKIEDEEKKND
jgi:small subunit ribosomal protein S2